MLRRYVVIFSVLALPALARAADASWAFKQVVKPDVPTGSDASWVRNPIDAFVLAKLDQAKLKPAPEADPQTLIRRLTFDLTGLPPTPEEIRAFLTDKSPDTY